MAEYFLSCFIRNFDDNVSDTYGWKRNPVLLLGMMVLRALSLIREKMGLHDFPGVESPYSNTEFSRILVSQFNRSILPGSFRIVRVSTSERQFMYDRVVIRCRGLTSTVLTVEDDPQTSQPSIANDQFITIFFGRNGCSVMHMMVAKAIIACLIDKINSNVFYTNSHFDCSSGPDQLSTFSKRFFEDISISTFVSRDHKYVLETWKRNKKKYKLQFLIETGIGEIINKHSSAMTAVEDQFGSDATRIFKFVTNSFPNDFADIFAPNEFQVDGNNISHHEVSLVGESGEIDSLLRDGNICLKQAADRCFKKGIVTPRFLVVARSARQEYVDLKRSNTDPTHMNQVLKQLKKKYT
jgi:hypothetical protein